MSNIALVGNGTSLIGAGLGREIDGHDHVARFPKTSGDTVMLETADWGLKTSAAVVTPRLLKTMPGESFPHGVGLMLYDKRSKSDAVMRLWLNMYCEIRTQGAMHFSRGTAAMIIVSELGFTKINCYGFDNIRDANNEHYKSMFRDRAVDDTLHDYAAKHKLLGEIANHYGVEIKCLPEKK